MKSPRFMVICGLAVVAGLAGGLWSYFRVTSVRSKEHLIAVQFIGRATDRAASRFQLPDAQFAFSNQSASTLIVSYSPESKRGNGWPTNRGSMAGGISVAPHQSVVVNVRHPEYGLPWRLHLYYFKTFTRTDLQRMAWASRLRRFLPTAVAKRIAPPAPQVREFVTPELKLEDILFPKRKGLRQPRLAAEENSKKQIPNSNVGANRKWCCLDFL